MKTQRPQTNSLYAKVEQLLKSVPEFITEEKELRYNKIKEMAENGDAVLLEPLLKDEKIRSAFFKPVLDSFVFKTKEFKDFLDYSSSHNSYSQYLGKKIGLYMGDAALTDRSEVVLNFPFKDCVLEGGQRKEDGLDAYFEYDAKVGDYIKKTAARREIFFNETLAKDEIDSLFSPKAFCNVKRYGENPQMAQITADKKTCTHFTRDAQVNRERGLSEDTITDNLIIKGNNLLALHSLKKEFEGKVKLIYIDPPYNTGSDDFKYNDNFNHSSWLTFMKNRLEVARELLREDGCIFVQCDDNEQAYLKVLMDEVFGRENFVNSVIWEKKFSPQNDAKWFSDSHDFILVYARNKETWRPNLLPRTEEMDARYKNLDNDPRGPWTSGDCSVKTYSGTMDYPITTPSGRIVNPPAGYCWRFSKEAFSEMVKDNRIWFGENGDNVPRVKRFLSEVKQGMTAMTIWKQTEVGHNQDAKKEVKAFNSDDVFATPKPERLIERVLTLASNPGDIVLDFFIGSATTAAVAHKMHRQYIGVEQMDYIETISCERLKKVIAGESGGISKSVNWAGGGSFVYMEMAERNEKAMRLISACKSYEELLSIFETLCEKYFLHYNVRINDFLNKTCKEDEFQKLSLKKQKEIFSRMIDLNQLYVNCDDRHDKDSGLSEDDIKATEDFYRIGDS